MIWVCPTDGREYETDGTGHVVCVDCGAGFDYDMAGVSGPTAPPREARAAELGIPIEEMEDCEECTQAELEEFARRFPLLAAYDQEVGAHQNRKKVTP